MTLPHVMCSIVFICGLPGIKSSSVYYAALEIMKMPKKSKKHAPDSRRFQVPNGEKPFDKDGQFFIKFWHGSVKRTIRKASKAPANGCS